MKSDWKTCLYSLRLMKEYEIIYDVTFLAATFSKSKISSCLSWDRSIKIWNINSEYEKLIGCYIKYYLLFTIISDDVA